MSAPVQPRPHGSFRPRASTRPALTTLRVALAGCGAVGGELVRMLDASHDALCARGIAVRLVRVLVRDVNRGRALIPFAPGILTSSVERFLATDADVTIEAIGGTDVAARVVRAALEQGRHVITANKALMAARGGELVSLAARHGAELRFDAAVGGGVPVLRLLGNSLGGRAPDRVRGILNGTSNFVLTLLETGRSLPEALAEARARGFAEADATRDLDGRDVADKVALVAFTAFGIAPERVAVRRRGILPDPERIVRLARLYGGRVRLVGDTSLERDGSVRASVEPVILRPSSALARVRFEENRIEVHAGWSAPLVAAGPGAGGRPTATALLSDLLELQAPLHLEQRADRFAVGDEAPHEWAFAARLAPSDLVERLDAHGLSADEPPLSFDDGSAVAIRARPWSEVARVEHELALAGLSPLVIQLEGDA